MSELVKLVKREWCYICKPAVYGITCDRCNGVNINWSEWDHLIWCYDCKVDTPGTQGVFDGPIPVNLMRLLGMPLDRYWLETGKDIARCFYPVAEAGIK